MAEKLDAPRHIGKVGSEQRLQCGHRGGTRADHTGSQRSSAPGR